MIQDRAMLSASGVVVEDMVVQSDGVTLMLRNSGGSAVYDLRVGMQHCSKTPDVYSYSKKIPVIAADSTVAVKMGCVQESGISYSYEKGDRVNAPLRLIMKKQANGFDHVYVGEIKFNVRDDLSSDGSA